MTCTPGGHHQPRAPGGAGHAASTWREDVAGGADACMVMVRGPRDNVQAALAALPGVRERDPASRPATAAGATTIEVVSAPRQRPAPAPLAGRRRHQGWELLDLRAVSLSLEDVFLRVTSAEEPMAEPDDAEYLRAGRRRPPTRIRRIALRGCRPMKRRTEAEAEADAEAAADPRKPPPAAAPPPQRPAAAKGGRR